MNTPNIYWELFVHTVRFHQTVVAPDLLVVRLTGTVQIVLQILGDVVISEDVVFQRRHVSD